MTVEISPGTAWAGSRLSIWGAFCFVCSAVGADAHAYCLEGVDVGMFTERRFSELDAPPRQKVNDAKLNALVKRGLRESRAQLVSIDALSRDEALNAAARLDLPLLAFLSIEATSREIPGYGEDVALVDINSTSTLQLLSTDDGQILGEASDIGATPGLDIEDALDDFLDGTIVERLAKQAERSLCSKGLPTTTPKISAAPSGQSPGSTAQAPDTVLIAKTQYALINAGFDLGAPDGLMGQQTVAAIKQAERKLQLPMSGRPSALLLQKLASLDKQLIYDLQKALADMGRLQGRPTGFLDNQTRRTIEEAELEFGITPPDGIPDRDLLKVLRAQAPADDHQDAAALPREAETAVDGGLQFRVQKLLMQLGYFEGPATEVASVLSGEAVREAERNLGLPIDGVPDEDLWRVLKAKTQE